MLEFELHFCAFIIAHFGIDVEYIHITRKQLRYPPLQMMTLARKSTNYH